MNEIHCITYIYVVVGTNLKLGIKQWIFPKTKILNMSRLCRLKVILSYIYWTENLSTFKAANFMKNGWHHHISEIRIQNLGKSVGCYICKMETTPKCSSCLSGVLHSALKTNNKQCNKGALKNRNIKFIFSYLWAKSTTNDKIVNSMN